MPEDTDVAPVHALSVGSFGHATVEYLRAFCTDLIETTVMDDTIPLPAVWPESSAYVVASWRPVRHFCQLLDELSWTRKRPFVPAMVDSTILRVGPVIFPGQGSCWQCWAHRYTQHDVWRQERHALLEHYASNPCAGPKGYLEPFSMIAASRLAALLDGIRHPNPPAGYIWQIDLITRQISSGVVVGVHDCPRCGLHMPAENRGSSRLTRELSYLWKDAAIDGQGA